MPCQDQTESLDLLLDQEDQLASFGLRKITCGQTVGGETLAPFVLGASVDQILTSTLEDFVADLAARKRIDSFLLFKQFFSIRAALLVLVGERSGEPSEPFALEEISFDSDGTTRIRGQIAVNLISEEIKSCGSCKNCRSIPVESPVQA